MVKKRKGVLGTFILGSIIGAVAGSMATIFMNTDSGKKLRKDLEKKYKVLSKDLSKKLKDVKVLTRKSYEKAVDEILKVSKQVKNLSKEDIAAIKDVLLEEWDVVYSKIKTKIKDKKVKTKGVKKTKTKPKAAKTIKSKA